MKTRRINKVAVLTIALLMLAGSNMYAQRGRNYSNQSEGFNQNQICQRIPDLTEDQQTKIEAHRLKHMKEINDFRNQKNELQAKKHTLMTSDNVTMNEINSVIDKLTSLQNKMMKSSAKHRRDIRDLLTEDQKVYFDSMPMRGRGHKKGFHSKICIKN